MLIIKTSSTGQQRKSPDKEKAKPIGKAKKNVVKTTSKTMSGPINNLHSQLKGKAKHTATLIQEITEEL